MMGKVKKEPSMDLAVRSVLVILKIGMLFVPQQKYTAKIEAISPAERKNVGCDLQGWDYRSIVSPRDGFVHHYYYYPSRKPNAPVLLCIHGLNLDGRTFLNLSGLSSEFQLIAYDLPESTGRYNGSFNDFQDIVEEFVHLMPIRECWVCGVSFGGGIALHLAAEHPECGIRGLVLISTGIVVATEKERQRNHQMSAWISGLPDYKIYWLMEKLYQRSERGAEGDTIRAMGTMLRVKNPAYYRQVVRSMDGFNAAAYARKVTCPVLVLSGDRDNLFPAKQVAAIKTYIPKAEMHIIPDGTHGMVFLKGRLIAERIAAFVKQNGMP
jgi:3-oxoadipate enol-lactonase